MQFLFYLTCKCLWISSHWIFQLLRYYKSLLFHTIMCIHRISLTCYIFFLQFHLFLWSKCLIIGIVINLRSILRQPTTSSKLESALTDSHAINNKRNTSSIMAVWCAVHWNNKQSWWAQEIHGGRVTGAVTSSWSSFGDISEIYFSNRYTMWHIRILNGLSVWHLQRPVISAVKTAKELPCHQDWPL